MTHLPLSGLPPAFLARQDEVSLWLASLDQPTDTFMRLLSSDELARAERFRFANHRQRWIAARGLLRIILADYLETAPASLQFEYGPQGKPSLASDFGQVAFNLAHAEDWALFAITGDGEIGVDLEVLPVHGVEEYPLPWVCSDREYAFLMNLPAPARQRNFLKLWTRKEALSKALGRGVTMVPLEQIDVLGEPTVDHPGPFMVTVPQVPGTWWLMDLALPGNLVAALAADHPFAKCPILSIHRAFR